jgi:hypothetical protein
LDDANAENEPTVEQTKHLPKNTKAANGHVSAAVILAFNDNFSWKLIIHHLEQFCQDSR